MASSINYVSSFLIAVVVLIYTSVAVKGHVTVAVYRFEDTARITWSLDKPVTKAKSNVAIRYRPINSPSKWINYKANIENNQAVIHGLQSDQRYSYDVAVFQNNALYARKSVVKEMCGNQWRWYNGSCFGYLDNQLASWQDARKQCQKYQGDLATIWTQNIMNFINTLPVKRYAWIGLMRQSGTFKWTSGINYNYSNWDTNQPINRGRDCVALIPIHSNSNGYRWMTQLCSHSYAYICQAPESSFNQQSNTGLIAALSIIAVAAVAIILCIAFAYKYPNSSLGRSLTKCRTGSCITMCKKSQSDFGNSSIRASRLKEEVIA